MNAGPTDSEPDKYRPGQPWDRVAPGWKKWWPIIDDNAQHVNDRLVELAEVAPGKCVLDIATGIGEPALSAAIRVGSEGRVVATDISRRMLDIARVRASAAGLTNVDFLEADAENLDFPHNSFDAILCRWGITSLPDYPNLLGRIKSLLKPKGSFATSVWDEASRLPLIGLAITVAHEMLHTAPPQSEPPPDVPEVALETAMISAGFSDVRTENLAVTFDFESAEEFIQYLVDVSPAVSMLLSDHPSRRQREYQSLLAHELRDHAAIDGRFRVHNVAICAVGWK